MQSRGGKRNTGVSPLRQTNKPFGLHPSEQVRPPGTPRFGRDDGIFVCAYKNALVVFLDDGGGDVAFAAQAEVAADEGVEVAVEDFVDIADLDAGA